MASDTDNKLLNALCNDRVWQLMIANLVIFIALHVAAWAGVPQNGLAKIVAIPAQPAIAVTRPWTLLLYMFAQYDFMHLLFNMMWLWTFGMLMSRLLVPGKIIVTAYFVGGFAAAGIWLLFGALGYVGGILLGSSAAVLAVLAAGGIILGKQRVNMVLFGDVQVRWLALAIVVLCILTDGSVQGLATVAVHISGVLAGIVTAVIYLKTPLLHKKKASTKYPDESAELDAILAKVRKGGYGALSTSEKKRLFIISSHISKK